MIHSAILVSVKKMQDASSVVSENDITSSADLSDGYKATADSQVSESLHMIHPCTPGIPITYIPKTRGLNRRRRMVTTKTKENPIDLGDDKKTDESKLYGKTKMKSRKSRGHYYNAPGVLYQCHRLKLLLSIL